jgi:hypothetical protein
MALSDTDGRPILIIQVGGTHDEVAEAVLRALTITDEKGEKANLTLKQKWAAESAVSFSHMRVPAAHRVRLPVQYESVSFGV